jgi:hypothetical protein
VNASLVGFVLISLFSGTLNAEERYLCIADLAVGITYQSGQPKIAQFNPNMFKFIVAKPDDPTKYTKPVLFVLRPFGEESNPYSTMTCLEPFTEYGRLDCDGVAHNFRMNKK